MPGHLWLFGLVLVGLGACSDEGEISSPCDLADAEMVGASFAGTVSEGVEGDFSNCDFEVEGGSVLSVSVFDYGDADGWDSTRQGFVDNRSGVTDIDGLGQRAFHPNDTGARELVVEAGGRIFSVTVFSGLEDPTTETMAGIADLSEAIALRLGS
ncbi:MAG TPA: hypothetical protein VK990_08865 [Acidimicrobiia bacterium]|nr:hypothetical protein [Acidimicrobiia bacterium]